MMPGTFEQHELSAAFPAMSDEARLALRDSVEDIGIQNAVVLFEGKVIDGWHRYCAARELGANCPTVELPADVDPRAFVLAQNRARRHLTASQVAFVVAAVHEWVPAHRPVADKSAPGADFPKTAPELAEIAGVGVRTIERAKAIVRDGAPEVQAAVQSGEVSVKQAAEIVKCPKPDQAAVLKAAGALKGKARTSDDEPQQERAIDAEDVPQAADLARELAEAVADNESMSRVFEANDQVAAAMAEAKRFREENRVLNERIHGLQNEVNAARRQAKYWQRRAEGGAA
ncbi:hypothetical protein [Methyloversatilis discipulorum]|jgi:hypothetical protein|uniref:hypothetical protein n=1 Tax=Methyloversatilis discipulorum TaxID=1119528 RepID=UPI003F334B93